MFKLDERLANDTCRVGLLPLCEVLLMNDSQFPWVILVPQLEGLTEILDLSQEDQTRLWEESRQVSMALRELCQPDKLNIAALGNVVSQLHLHHVARYKNDVAWPAPVWGRQPAVPYPQDQKVLLCQQLAEKLGI
ncbi:HIT domain-containing protein [Alteromonas antoniana]|uniref:HIT domain-containing protein n=1 Tax=Alteromonas antoniana TaxID=2803813 RepID=UPI001C466334|nr:HIT domain-containing protein [Alteromonas antoniana]